MVVFQKAYVSQVILTLLLASIMFLFQYLKLSQYLSARILSTQDVSLFDAPSVMIQDRTKKHLPMFTETGGIVVFLHVAKTGGTSIRDDINELEGAKVKRVMDEEQLRGEAAPIINWHLSKRNTNKQTLLIEIHGGHGEPMTIFQLHPYLQRWRRQAAENNKQVFVFTLLREPLSFHLSYFNFFKPLDCKFSWCDQPLMELTEENLLASFIPNHQCQYLSRQYDKEENSAVPVSQQECEAVYELLKNDMDWIGTTETMQDTTLPLLSFMLSGNAETGRSMEVRNKQKSNGKLSRNALSDESITRIRAASSADQYLYDRVVADYDLSMWENFFEATAKL